MTSGAENFTAKTKAQKPVTFTPAAHERVRKINKMTGKVVTLSAQTVGQVTKVAQNFGASLTRRGEAPSKSDKLDAKVGKGYTPGILNKSMIAFSTIADGVEVSGKHLLSSGGSAATHVVGHRYGEDARKVASELTKSVTNVGLVYIDVTGVSRRAVIKSVAKGMVVGKVAGGGTVMVGGGDGGDLPENLLQAGQPIGGSIKGGQSSAGAAPPSYTPGDYKTPPGGYDEKPRYS